MLNVPTSDKGGVTHFNILTCFGISVKPTDRNRLSTCSYRRVLQGCCGGVLKRGRNNIVSKFITCMYM